MPNVVWWGAVAQLGERLVRNEEVSGSIPLSSTKKLIAAWLTDRRSFEVSPELPLRRRAWSRSFPASHHNLFESILPAVQTNANVVMERLLET